jgi:hypothetical protein
MAGGGLNDGGVVIYYASDVITSNELRSNATSVKQTEESLSLFIPSLIGRCVHHSGRGLRTDHLTHMCASFLRALTDAVAATNLNSALETAYGRYQ